MFVLFYQHTLNYYKLSLFNFNFNDNLNGNGNGNDNLNGNGNNDIRPHPVGAPPLT